MRPTMPNSPPDTPVSSSPLAMMGAAGGRVTGGVVFKLFLQTTLPESWFRATNCASRVAKMTRLSNRRRRG